MENKDISTNSIYLAEIEQCINRIVNNKDVETNLKNMANYINREFKCNCLGVNIVENDTLSYFFGAQVIPSQMSIQSISTYLTEMEDKSSVKNLDISFYLELDSKFLYEYDTTDREIVAVIIHEIGHRIADRSHLQKLKGLYNSELIKKLGINYPFNYNLKSVKFLLGTVIIFSYTEYLSYWYKLNSETLADSYAIKYGYGADLHSFLTKLTNSGAFIKAVREEDNKNTSQEIMVSWSVKNILEFSLRRANIEKELRNQLREEKSKAIRDNLEFQLNMIRRSIGKGLTTPFSNENCDLILSESIKSFIEIKKKGMSHLELDEIQVEIEIMESPDDKIYLITRIHRDISKAKKAMSKIKNEVDKQTYQEYIDSLNKFLKEIRNKKVKEEKNEFVIRVDYPEDDYER